MYHHKYQLEANVSLEDKVKLQLTTLKWLQVRSLQWNWCLQWNDVN